MRATSLPPNKHGTGAFAAESIRLLRFKNALAETPLPLESTDPAQSDTYRTVLVLTHLDLAQQIHAHLSQILSRHQLTDLQFKLSLALHAKADSPVPASALAAHAGVSKSAVTIAVDQLVKKGLALRARDPGDRRFICVQLTAAGLLTTRNALTQYLQAAAAAARHLDLPSIHASLDICSALKKGLTTA